MKYTKPLRAFLLSSGAMLAAHSVQAADVTWDITPGTVGAGDSAVTGGTGTWDTTNGNWTTDAGVNNVAWDNGTNDTAIFGGTTGTVTLDADVTVGGLTFNTNNYSIAPGVGPYSITFGAPGDINVSTGTSTILAPIAGSNTITKTGTGTLRLDGVSNSFTGNVAVTGGTLQIGNNNTTARLGGATYAGDIDLDGGNLLITNNQTQNLSGIISGTGSLNKGGSGILTLSGANTYTGKTSILGSGAGGPGLSVSSFNSVVGGSSSSSLGAPTTVANGTIEFGSGGNQRSSTLIYTGAGETTDRVMFIGFNSANNHQLYSSGTGLLKFTSAFDINKSTGTSASGLTLRGDGDGEIAGGFTGDAITGKLDKDDAGTWTITGTVTANSSTVKAGTLILNGSFSTAETTKTAGGTVVYPAGALTVNSGATLGGSATLNGEVIVNGTLTPGNSPGQMTIGAASSLTLGGTSTTLMELEGTTLGTQYDNLTMNALATALTYGGNLNVVNFGAYDMDTSSFVYDLFSLNDITPTGDFASVTVNSISLSNSGGLWTGVNGDVTYEFSQALGDLTIVAIPEPSSLVLLGGFGALLLARRRR